MRTRRLSRRKRTKSTTRRQKGGQDPLNIRYGSIKIQGQPLTSKETHTQPSYTVPKGHTLIMYDPDAPAGIWLHWLRHENKDLVPYTPPTPPSGTHHYIFRLVEGSPAEIPKERAPINPTAIAPGRVKGEVMFYQSA